MSKKNERMARLFGAIHDKEGYGRINMTQRAIWMSARELGAGQITFTQFSEGGLNIETAVSPSAVMAAYDQNDDGTDETFTVYVSGAPSLELYSSHLSDGPVYTWEDVLRAGKAQREIPDTIMIDGREYQYEEQFNDKADAEAAAKGTRAAGTNAQVRRKGGQYVLYTRPRAAKKEKPAKKAPAKKAKKAKTPQPKAKKPSSRKKAGGKGKA